MSNNYYDARHANMPLSNRSNVVAFFLAFFFGVLGIHKFYNGSWGWGLLYIILSAGTFAVWVIVPITESIFYLLRPKKYDEKYNWRPATAFKW